MEKLQAKANDDAESGEEEAQVGLEATEDEGSPVAAAVVLPPPPDGAFVVEVTSGVDGCDDVIQ